MKRQPLVHHISRLLLLGLLSACVLVLSACDSGGDNGGEGGEDGFPAPPGRPGFTSSVAGSWRARLTGTAAYAASDRSAGATSPFTLWLEEGRDGRGTTIVLRAVDGEHLRPGTYVIAARERGQGVTATIARPDQPAWDATAGTLTIIRRDDGQVEGQFRFTVTDGANRYATVTGAFTAVR